MGATHGMQEMHRVFASVDQGQEEFFEVWNSHGLEGADKPCYFCAIEILVPVCGDLPAISDEDSSTTEESEDVVFDPDAPRPLSQEALNDLVRDTIFCAKIINVIVYMKIIPCTELFAYFSPFSIDGGK